MLLFLSVIEDEVVSDALERVYYLYKKEMFYTANSILKDYHEAEDVVHTAIIKLAGYVDENFEAECHKTRSLLVIIVRNLSINIYNQRKRRGSVNIEDLEDVLCDDSDTSPELNVLRLDQSREMAKSLSEINPGYADILALKYTYQYSNTEIASILSITEDNVRKKLSRAKASLKNVILGKVRE